MSITTILPSNQIATPHKTHVFDSRTPQAAAVAVAVPLSSVPYFDAHLIEPAFKVFVFADMVKAQSLNPPKRQQSASTRKTVKGFSNKSRKRMIEHLAKVVEVPDLFVTLTYSDDIINSAKENMHAHFEAFRRRLERAYPGIRAMWRIEFVPRKSGRFIGTFQPHFHLLVWLPKTTTQAQKEAILEGDGKLWRAAWHKIIRSRNEVHLEIYGAQVEVIRNRKHAYKYASKYLAKTDYENIEAGRRWGYIGKFEMPVQAEMELTHPEYIQFKRLLNKYIKHKSYQFFKHFRRLNVHTGSSVFGLGFISQDSPLGARTIYRLLLHAKELAALQAGSIPYFDENGELNYERNLQL